MSEGIQDMHDRKRHDRKDKNTNDHNCYFPIGEHEGSGSLRVELVCIQK
jgi:hypothetical protein